jgi:serine/threonine protein kinase/Flp pilus assembly protein TadD
MEEMAATPPPARRLAAVRDDFNHRDESPTAHVTPEAYDSDIAPPSENADSGPTRLGDSFPPLGRHHMTRGTVVGRYILLEPLGSGGIGDVYTAYDPQLDRQVAVKLLKASAAEEVASGEGADRLLREAQAMARLAHPNVVAVHDVGKVGHNVFIAMEKVDGTTLSRWMRAQRRSWKEIRDVLVQAGRGLAAAHEAGIVHRDFKPTNVIVSSDGRARVLDFGLARSVGGHPRHTPIAGDDLNHRSRPSFESASLETPMTMPGTVMGTPPYMPPEQIAGTGVGPVSDQFSFCVTFWEALYGRRPFLAESMPGVVRAIQQGLITEPEDRKDVPAWLHKILIRGLSTIPADRFGSMDRLLHAALRDRRSRRRQWLGLGMVATLSAAAAGVGVFMFGPQPTARERNEVEILINQARAAAARSYFVYPPSDEPDSPTAYRKLLELEAREGRAEALADQRAEELRTEFAQTLTRLGDRFHDQPGGAPFAADYYAATLIFDPDNAHARGRTTLTPGEIGALRDRATQGDFTEAELLAGESLAVLAEENDDIRVERVTALYSRDQTPSPSTSARLESLLGERETRAMETATHTTNQRRRQALSKPSAAVADANENLQPGTELAPETTPSVVPVKRAPLESDGDSTRRDPKLAREAAKEGLAAFRRGDFRNAESAFHRALSFDRGNAAALAGLGELHFEQGAYQKAVQYAQKAVARSPKNARYRIVLGDAYFKILGYESARREYQKAKALGSKVAGARLAQLDARLGR